MFLVSQTRILLNSAFIDSDIVFLWLSTNDFLDWRLNSNKTWRVFYHLENCVLDWTFFLVILGIKWSKKQNLSWHRNWNEKVALICYIQTQFNQPKTWLRSSIISYIFSCLIWKMFELGNVWTDFRPIDLYSLIYIPINLNFSFLLFCQLCTIYNVIKHYGYCIYV